jgi:hypothetical protein
MLRGVWKLTGMALLISLAVLSGMLHAASPALLKIVQQYTAEFLVLFVCLACALIATGIIIRGRTLGPHVPELLVLIVGLITGLIAAVAIPTKEIAVVAVLISFLLAVSTFSLKREISERMAAVSKLHLAQSRIHNVRWRTEANERIEDLEMEIGGWAAGQRTLPHERSIPYQIELLAGASRSMDAIHIALSQRALTLWDRDSGKFSAMVEAHVALPKSVVKRRIMVIDDADPEMVSNTNGVRMLKGTAVRVCQRQIEAQPNGLGVQLQILWKSHVARVDREQPRDLLLVDDAEAVIVTIREDSTPGGAAGDHKYETQIYVDPTRVRAHRRRFEAYWAVSTPVSHAMPPASSNHHQTEGK